MHWARGAIVSSPLSSDPLTSHHGIAAASFEQLLLRTPWARACRRTAESAMLTHVCHCVCHTLTVSSMSTDDTLCAEVVVAGGDCDVTCSLDSHERKHSSCKMSLLSMASLQTQHCPHRTVSSTDVGVIVFSSSVMSMSCGSVIVTSDQQT